MKSDLELAVESSKALESLLEKNYSATGRGLHEKVDSVSEQLPVGVIRDLRFIATLRNKIVHEGDTQSIDDRPGFTAVVQRLVGALSPKPVEPEVKPRSTVKRTKAKKEVKPIEPEVRPSVPSAHIMTKETPKVPHFWEGWNEEAVRFLVAVISALAGMAISAKSGEDPITSLLIAGVAAFCGYWFGHVLAGVAILCAIIVGFSLLILVYLMFKK